MQQTDLSKYSDEVDSQQLVLQAWAFPQNA